MDINEDNLRFIYENINALFPLNFIVSNNKSGIVKRFNAIEVPEHIKEEEKEITKIVVGKLANRSKEVVYQVESTKKLRYIGFGIYEKGIYEGAIIVGPYLKELISSVVINDGERAFYENIAIISNSQQWAISNIVIAIINEEKIIKASIEKDKSVGVKSLNCTLNDYEMSLGWIKEMYKTERTLLYYVSLGNKEGALDLMSDTYRRINDLNRFPENPTRNVKNLSIVMNTLLRKTIESSGVDEYFIHTTSEYFAVRIENSLTIRELLALMSEMVAQYCDLVNEYNTKPYSELVSNAITYMKLNFKTEISLTSIANELFIHPTYLAKKFKQETGKTVSEYVNEIRIKEAQFIMMTTEFKIEDIAYHVGYNDKKYFSKTFKKIVGISPSEYRKYNKEVPIDSSLK